ncbi:hypothetical protein TNCV_1561911 [Trichonephila clavipes]|nr:hypothetical protein TNCV_1561911 [Trichonephila clavipes]
MTLVQGGKVFLYLPLLSPRFLCSSSELLGQLFGDQDLVYETESMKSNDMEFFRGPGSEEKKYPSDPLVNIH